MKNDFQSPAEERIREKARELRRNQTEAEAVLWKYLKNRQLDGFKFRRQHTLGYYICDFACLEAKLIVELDGGQHNEVIIAGNDEERTNWFKSQGYKLIRFGNNDVLENIERVILEIKAVLRPSPDLSPDKYGTFGLPGRGKEGSQTATGG
jgi:very-short-patch-repair endonuclease